MRFIVTRVSNRWKAVGVWKRPWHGSIAAAPTPCPDGQVTDVGGSTFSTELITWTYDALSRLIKEVYDCGNNDTPPGGAGLTADDYTAAYEYDLESNRMLKTTDQSNDGTIDQVIASSYISNNELHQEMATSPTSKLPAYSTSYTYDNNGSTLTITRTGNQASTMTYSYDLRNRIAGVNVNGTSTSYTYNTDDELVGQATGGAATLYLRDPNNPTGYSLGGVRCSSASHGRCGGLPPMRPLTRRNSRPARRGRPALCRFPRAGC